MGCDQFLMIALFVLELAWEAWDRSWMPKELLWLIYFKPLRITIINLHRHKQVEDARVSMGCFNESATLCVKIYHVYCQKIFSVDFLSFLSHKNCLPNCQISFVHDPWADSYNRTSENMTLANVSGVTNVALNGYDPVSFFDNGSKPTNGNF